MSEKPRNAIAIGSLVRYADELRLPGPAIGVVVPLEKPYWDPKDTVGVKWNTFPLVVEEWAKELEVISEGR